MRPRLRTQISRQGSPILGGFSFGEAAIQSFNLLPRTSAIDNVALPLLYAMSGQGHARVRYGEFIAIMGASGSGKY